MISQWNAVAASPYTNQALQTSLFAHLVAAARTPAAARTAAQAYFVSRMEDYIESKKIFIAQTALDMYDAWKQTSDQEKQRHRQSQVGQSFDYGTVPPDFSGMTVAVLTLVGSVGAAGGGLVGTLVALGQFREAEGAFGKTNPNAIYRQLLAGSFFKNFASLASLDFHGAEFT